MQTWQDRISIDPAILVGKPVIKGTRLAVEFLIELLSEGWTFQQLLENYPPLTPDDIHAALGCAVEALKRSCPAVANPQDAVGMFEKGAIVTINNEIGVVVLTGQDLCDEGIGDLEDHTGIWFCTFDGGIPEVWTIPTEYLLAGPRSTFKH